MGKGAGWMVAIGRRLSVAMLAASVLVVAVMLGIAIYVVLFDPPFGRTIWPFVTGFVALVAAGAGVLHIVRNHDRVRKNLMLLLSVLLILFVGLFVGLYIASPSKYENAVEDTAYALAGVLYSVQDFFRLVTPPGLLKGSP